jgi:hypothetical protein
MMPNKTERIAYAGIAGLIALAISLVSEDHSRPAWTSWVIGPLFIGWFAWLHWKPSGEPDKRTLDVILPGSMVVFAAISMLILLIARL